MSKKASVFLKKCLSLVVLMAWGASSAAWASTPALVETGWVARHIGDPKVVIINVRTESNYDFAHIPGAVSIPYGDLETPGDKGFPLMVEESELTELLQDAGVQTDSHVIVYGQGNTVSDVTKAAAAYWILKSNGLRNVSLLNGGFTKWTFEGRKVVKAVPKPRKGDFVAHRDHTKIATLRDVAEALSNGKVFLVDARNPAQHFGVSKRSDVSCYGHITYSVNLPAAYLTNAGANRAPATLKSKRALVKLVEGAALPADKNKKIIVYCNTGQFAGLDYFILAGILGYKRVKLYDGSMKEYCSEHGNLPLERFAWGRPEFCAECLRRR